MSKPDRVSSKKYQGVYWRESSERRHHGKPDRIYWICYRAGGKLKWERIGPASQGITEEFCNQKRISVLNKLNLGEDPVAARATKREVPTVDEIMDDYLMELRNNGKGTRSVLSGYGKHVAPKIGRMRIADITAEDAGTLKSELLARVSAGSAHRILGSLAAAVNIAIRRKKFVGINPFSAAGGFRRPRPQNAGERFLSPEEAHTLLEALGRRSGELRDMAFLALHTGLRATEIMEIKGGDVDTKSRVLHIRSKGGQRQAVHMTEPVAAMLIERQTGPGAYVFPARNGGRLGQIPVMFRKVVDEIGFNDGIKDNKKKVWFHTLRHTFASWLAQSGQVGIQELMKLMRHKQISMTLRYAHLLPDAGKDKMAIIGKMLDLRQPSGRESSS